MTAGRADEATDRRAAHALPLGPAVLYAGALVAFAVAGLYGPVVNTLLAGLFLIAIVTGRLRAFVGDWAVFLAGLALFDSLRAGVFALVNSLGLPVHMGYVIRLERALFGGETLPTRLQAALLRPDSPGALVRLLVVAHASHFVAFLLFGLGLWLARREAFGRFAAALLLVMSLGIVGHLAVPTVPPWMAADLGAIPPVHRVADDVYGKAVPGLRRAFDTNPIAAMPSLHAAFPGLVALVGLHHLGARAWPLVVYLGLVSLAAVVLGEHYFLDIVAGVLLAAAAYWLLYRTRLVAGRRRRAVRRGDPAGPSVARWSSPTGRRLVLAAALLVLAVGVSQATLRMRRPFTLPETFVERELGGRPGGGPVCPRC